MPKSPTLWMQPLPLATIGSNARPAVGSRPRPSPTVRRRHAKKGSPSKCKPATPPPAIRSERSIATTPISRERNPGWPPAGGTRRTHASYATASLAAFTARALTTLRAGLAVKTVGSLVNGLMPLRSLGAGFLTTTMPAAIHRWTVRG